MYLHILTTSADKCELWNYSSHGPVVSSRQTVAILCQLINHNLTVLVWFYFPTSERCSEGTNGGRSAGGMWGECRCAAEWHHGPVQDVPDVWAPATQSSQTSQPTPVPDSTSPTSHPHREVQSWRSHFVCIELSDVPGSQHLIKDLHIFVSFLSLE